MIAENSPMIDLGTKKKEIEDSWATDASWSDRTANRRYDETADFIKLTAMLDKLSKTGKYDRVVEIGCGDAKYASYLREKITVIADWVATDIQSPRLDRAKQEVHSVTIEALNILECQNKYNARGTVFLAANVFGNISPDDMNTFFERMNVGKTGLVFLAGGLTIEETASWRLRENGIAFDHNFIELVRKSKLTNLEYEISYHGGRTRTAGYWMSGSVD